MRKLLAIFLILACASIASARSTVVVVGGGVSVVAGGCHSGPEYSETFGSDLSSWTVESTYGATIVTGQLRASNSGETTFLRYNTSIPGTTQYGCFDISAEGTDTYDYVGIVFRWVDEGARYYLINDQANNRLEWIHATSDTETGFAEQANSSGSISTATGDRICMTIQGTSTSTKLSVWKNTTNRYPCDADNWDSASDAADWTSSNPTSKIDTGTFYMGIYFYDGGTLDVFTDNWTAGDLN